jgi:hypothetical protein
MEYVVYCDESRHCARQNDTHMTIGGLWVSRAARDSISRQLRQVARNNGLGSELKWSKISEKYLGAYKQVVDFFFDQHDLNYRSIVVDHRDFDLSYHDGDRELGFYKFYFRMLEKWILDGNEYTILLDFQKNRGAGRFGDLRQMLVNAVPKARIRELTVVESSETPLAQLSDVLTGAVAAAWCRSHESSDSPKAKLVDHIASRLGWLSLRGSSTSPAWSKFNLFSIDLSQQA